MFTGIIESLGEIVAITTEQSNIHFDIKSSLLHDLKIDQSVAHDGCCLTVVALHDGSYRVTAIQETLDKTALSTWQVGRTVNIERCTAANGRFDGHIVQGHVDTTTECICVSDKQGSWVYRFRLPDSYAHLIVDKGSICINGVSLTVSLLGEDFFEVSIIPYTYDHTTFKQLKSGNPVNLEFDIIGKYVERILSTRQK